VEKYAAFSWFIKGFAITTLILVVLLMVFGPPWVRALGVGLEVLNDRKAPVQEQVLPMPESDLSTLTKAAEDVSLSNDGSPLVIPAAAFSSDGSDPDGFFFNFAGYLDGNGTACLKAPAYLPDGVTVTDLYASLYDNSTSDIFVTLRRVDVSSGTSDNLAEVSSTSASSSIQSRQDNTINYADVSYPLYAYYVTTCLNSVDHRLYSVRIYYTVP
jgi:hypothetical protein